MYKLESGLIYANIVDHAKNTNCIQIRYLYGFCVTWMIIIREQTSISQNLILMETLK